MACVALEIIPSCVAKHVRGKSAGPTWHAWGMKRGSPSGGGVNDERGIERTTEDQLRLSPGSGVGWNGKRSCEKIPSDDCLIRIGTRSQILWLPKG